MIVLKTAVELATIEARVAPENKALMITAYLKGKLLRESMLRDYLRGQIASPRR